MVPLLVVVMVVVMVVGEGVDFDGWLSILV